MSVGRIDPKIEQEVDDGVDSRDFCRALSVNELGMVNMRLSGSIQQKVLNFISR